MRAIKNEWLHFIECINKENTPNISFQDGMKVLDIIDSIKMLLLLAKG